MRRRLAVLAACTAVVTAWYSAAAGSRAATQGAPAANAPAAAAPAVLPPQEDTARAIVEAMSVARDGSRDDRAEDDLVAESVRRYYAGREYRAAWLDPHGRATAAVLLQRLEAAAVDGLCAAAYGTGPLRARLVATGPGHPDAGALDVALTEAFMRFLRDVGLGHPAGDAVPSARRLDLASALERIRAAGGAPAALDGMMPRHPEYLALREALRTYRAIAAAGGWLPVPDDLFLRPGDPLAADAGEALVRRLMATGDLESYDPEATPGLAGVDDAGEREGTADAVEGPVYDDRLVEAVRHFQRRHGLLVDGIIGPQTVGALNAPVAERIRQIALNMDRWRRLPDDLGPLHVRVNIPDFTLAVVEDGREQLAMRTIVGRSDRQTPVFSDRVQYLEFRPYWNVPDRIARDDILPRLEEDPGYLERRRFDVVEDWDADAMDPGELDLPGDVFPYRLRQRPGSHNELGLVKFMFPNRYAVYLHDTPSRGLFNRAVRTFSSGCVRVERPVELAEALLRHEEWSAEAVEAAMQGDRRQVVRLSEPVPVHLMYPTAWVGEGERVEFRPDVYERDARAAGPAACETTDR